MTVSRVTGRAGVSRRTFYDVFEDREDCFLAAFEESIARVSSCVTAAYESERTWHEQVRAALAEMLGFLDGEPGARAVLVVDALKAGPAVLDRRAAILEQLSRALHEGGTLAAAPRELPPLTGEGVVGAVLGMIHTRLLQPSPGRMLELLNPAMGMIALAYLGSAAAQAELMQPLSRLPHGSLGGERDGEPRADPLMALPMRFTFRTLLALKVVGERPGASNSEIAALAEVADQGQISRLLSRLEGLGLVENAGDGQSRGERNAWQLTPRGREVQQAIGRRSGHTNRKANTTGESH